MGADITDGQRVELRMFSEVSHQAILTDQHHGLLNPRQLVELGFDLA